MSARAAALQPIPAKRVERVLRDAWGGRAGDELDDLEREPAAVTPTAQVHRGVLDGGPVAIKIQRPGLAAAIRQDLVLLDGLRRPLAAAFPAIDAAALLGEFRERALEQLDLEHEASVQRRFHRALRRHPCLVVPEPVMRLSQNGVLVGEWIDGVPLHRAPDAAAAAARLVAFVLGSARTGSIYGGADPDDVLLLADGRLAILGYGMTAAVEPDRVDSSARLVQAAIDDDRAGFGAALAQLGWLDESHAGDALALVRLALRRAERAGPGSPFDRDAVIALRDRVGSRATVVGRLAVAGTPPAPDLWPVLAVAQLFATIARVGAVAAWPELVSTALALGWSAAV